MGNTPGIPLPSSFDSQEDLINDIHRRDEEAGFVPLDLESFAHSETVDEFLEHFGVKGMHWGVRNDRVPGLSRSVDRQARKDAEETARAKLFYGDGAGTRRKLIKAQVEGRSKNNSAYAKAFADHLSKQDKSKHADKAISERKRKDRNLKTKQRAGFLARHITGEVGTQAAFGALVIGGVAFLASPKGQAMFENGVKKISDIKNSRQSKKGIKLITDYMKK